MPHSNLFDLPLNTSIKVVATPSSDRIAIMANSNTVHMVRLVGDGPFTHTEKSLGESAVSIKFVTDSFLMVVHRRHIVFYDVTSFDTPGTVITTSDRTHRINHQFFYIMYCQTSMDGTIVVVTHLPNENDGMRSVIWRKTATAKYEIVDPEINNTTLTLSEPGDHSVYLLYEHIHNNEQIGIGMQCLRPSDNDVLKIREALQTAGLYRDIQDVVLGRLLANYNQVSETPAIVDVRPSAIDGLYMTSDRRLLLWVNDQYVREFDLSTNRFITTSMPNNRFAVESSSDADRYNRPFSSFFNGRYILHAGPSTVETPSGVVDISKLLGPMYENIPDYTQSERATDKYTVPVKTVREGPVVTSVYGPQGHIVSFRSPDVRGQFYTARLLLPDGRALITFHVAGNVVRARYWDMADRSNTLETHTILPTEPVANTNGGSSSSSSRGSVGTNLKRLSPPNLPVSEPKRQKRKAHLPPRSPRQ
jgi:hypothetical protein